MSGTAGSGTIDVANGPPGMGEVFVLNGVFAATSVTVEGGGQGYPSGILDGSGGTLDIDGTLVSSGSFDIMGGSVPGGASDNYSPAAGTGGLVVNDGSLVNSGFIDAEGGGGMGYEYHTPDGAMFSNNGELTNIGTILLEHGEDGNADGSAGASALLSNTGLLTNSGSIEIQGGDFSNEIYYVDEGGFPAELANSGSLVNSGTLSIDGGQESRYGDSPPGVGASLVNTGVLTNSGSLLVEEGQSGDYSLGGGGGQLSNDGTIINTGTLVIDGGQLPTSIYYNDGMGGTLDGTGTILDTGSILTGTNSSLSGGTLVEAGTLQLDGYASFDTLSDFGTIEGSGTLETNGLIVVPGPEQITLGFLYDNSGTIEVAQSLDLNAVVNGEPRGLGGGSSGYGVIALADGARLDLEQSPNVSSYDPDGYETIAFEGATGTVQLAASIASAFGTFDVAGLAYGPASAATLDGDLLTVTNGVETNVYTLIGEPDDTMFSVSDDGSGGTLVTVDNPCFAQGTSIETPYGPIRVEDLQVGDEVTTQIGTALVRWIGHRRASNVDVIRFSPDALPVGPDRDLFVSEDHAMFLDGALVPAGLLVDGRTIVRERRETVTFWHVELETHGILFAEGAPVESYLDTGNRRQYGNCPLAYDPVQASQDPCAEVVLAGTRLAELRAMLARRAGQLAGTAAA